MEYQGHAYNEISVEQFCQVIDLLHPCMDDYLYIYDFLNDFFYVTPCLFTQRILKTSRQILKNIFHL